jgi:membrane-associated protease RseP (regulator of RpoE activity)
MRRFQALLIAVGLAAAPAGAAAGPSKDKDVGPAPQTYEKFEWSMSKGRLGVVVMSLTPELRKHFGAAEDRGVLVAHVESGTPAAAAGVAVGDVIVDVRGHAIDGASDVLAALADVKKGQTATVAIVRDKKPLSLQVTLADDAPPNVFDPRWQSGMRWWRQMMSPFFGPDAPTPFDEPTPSTKPHESSLRS